MTGTTLNPIIYVPNRLLTELDAISQYPLTLLIAPSGSGKTISVQEYFRRNIGAPAKAHWYIAFGESLQTIWKRLCSVIAKIDDKTANALRTLETPVRESFSEIAEIMQGIRCTEPTALVIDNYQTIQNGASYELLLALSQHGNCNLHIVVITQQLDDGAVPLSAPHIAKLDAKLFLFDETETVAYTEDHGFRLTHSEIIELMNYTSGWISAVQLQLLHYQLTGSFGKDQDIDQLLWLVVWEPLDSGLKTLLASLSLLPAINAKQAAVMLGSADIGYIVRLLNNFAFVSFDAESQCYILHNLLRTFLRERFEEHDEITKKVFYRRAGEAQLLIRELFSALQFFSLSGDYDAALSVPLRNSDMVGVESSALDAELGKILLECPHEKQVKYPYFFLVFAFELYARGQKVSYDACRSVVLEAIRICEANNDAGFRKIRGEYQFLCALSAFNNIEEMGKFHNAALADLGGPSGIFDFTSSWTPASPSVLYMYWRSIGALSDEILLLEKHLPVYYTLTNGHGMGGPALMQAEAALNSGRLSGAEALCHKAIYLSSSKQQDSVCLGSEFVLARIAMLRGDPDEYTSCISGLRSRLLFGKENALRLTYDLCLAWLSLCLGSKDSFPHWLLSKQSIHEHVYGQNTSFAMLVYTKILLVTHDFNKLFGITDVLLNKAESVPIQLARVYYLIYMACAKIMTGNQDDAAKYLRKALDIALPDQVYLPFAEHWVWLTNILPEVRTHISDQQGIDRIISMCAKQKSGVMRIGRALNKTKSSLTVRELEIVQLVKQGKTNKEIADILFITPETVKMALKKIFQKLDVRSRFQI